MMFGAPVARRVEPPGLAALFRIGGDDPLDFRWRSAQLGFLSRHLPLNLMVTLCNTMVVLLVIAPGLSASERAELQAQAAQLRGELRGEEFVRRGDERRLAATPVDFAYFGNTGAAGIDSSRPFGSALEASSGAFGTMSAWLLTVIGLLLPWALLLGAFVGIWHLLRRRKAAPPVQE